jgi:hypothetical protein
MHACVENCCKGNTIDDEPAGKNTNELWVMDHKTYVAGQGVVYRK